MSQVTLADRLQLMTQLAFAFAVLHEQDWVFGDFSYQTGAFALGPPGCSSSTATMRPACPTRSAGSRTRPGWYPPECEGPGAQQHQDHKTDVYKLGLAIARTSSPQSVPPPRATRSDWPASSTRGGWASSAPRCRRTATRGRRPKRYSTTSKGFTDPLISPPTIEHTELITPVVWRGTDGQADGRVAWRIAKADRIDILLGEDQPTTVRTVTPADYPNGCAFPVARPGKVTVVASNRYGRQARVLGDVTILAISPSSLDFYKVTDSAIVNSTVKTVHTCRDTLSSHMSGRTQIKSISCNGHCKLSASRSGVTRPHCGRAKIGA